SSANGTSLAPTGHSRLAGKLPALFDGQLPYACLPAFLRARTRQSPSVLREVLLAHRNGPPLVTFANLTLNDRAATCKVVMELTYLLFVECILRYACKKLGLRPVASQSRAWRVPWASGEELRCRALTKL